MKHCKFNSFVWLILLPISFCESNAQQLKTDSLRNELGKSGNDTYSIYVALAKCYGNEMTEYDSALFYLTKANEIILRSADSAKIIETGRMLGVAYNWKFRYQESINACLTVVPIAIKARQWLLLGRLYNLIGLAYIELGEFDKALDYLLNAQELKKNNNMTVNDEFVSMNNIGFVYYRLDNHEKAIEYFLHGLEITNKDEQWDYSTLVLNLSSSYSSIGNFNESRKYFASVIKECRTKECLPRHKLLLEVTQGLYYFRRDSLSEAEMHFKIGKDIARQTNDFRLTYDCHYHLAKIYQRKGDVRMAKQTLIEAESMAKEFRRELLDIYSQFVSLYKSEGAAIKVAEYQEKYINLKDSIYNERLTANLMQLHADAEEQEDLSEINSQVRMLKLKSEVVNGQRVTNVLMGGGVVILSAILALLFWINHARKHASRLLNQRVTERTRDLKHNHFDLERSLKQRSNQMGLLTSDIQKSIKAMTSLCIKGMEDTENRRAFHYFQQIETTTKKLSQVVESASAKPA